MRPHQHRRQLRAAALDDLPVVEHMHEVGRDVLGHPRRVAGQEGLDQGRGQRRTDRVGHGHQHDLARDLAGRLELEQLLALGVREAD